MSCHLYRCPIKKADCKFCEADGSLKTVMNHNKKGITCPNISHKPVFLTYEGQLLEQLPQEYLPELNRREREKNEKSKK